MTLLRWIVAPLLVLVIRRVLILIVVLLCLLVKLLLHRSKHVEELLLLSCTAKDAVVSLPHLSLAILLNEVNMVLRRFNVYLSVL